MLRDFLAFFATPQCYFVPLPLHVARCLSGHVLSVSVSIRGARRSKRDCKCWGDGYDPRLHVIRRVVPVQRMLQGHHSSRGALNCLRARLLSPYQRLSSVTNHVRNGWSQYAPTLPKLFDATSLEQRSHTFRRFCGRAGYVGDTKLSSMNFALIPTDDESERRQAKRNDS
jgi:hypothetical protein